MSTTTEQVALTNEQRALVDRNIGLARMLALEAWRKNPGQDRDDLISAAYLGLVKAAGMFDPSRANVVDGVPDLAGAFAGYARRKITGEIMEWQRKCDHVPKRKRSVYKTLEAMGHGNGRSPEELSDLTGMPVERIRAVIAAVEYRRVPLGGSYWSPDGDDSEIVVGDDPASSSTVDSQALEVRIRNAVVLVFDDLTDTQQVIVALRYYEGMDLTAIAATLGIRLTIVRAEHAEAVLLLHEAMVREAS